MTDLNVFVFVGRVVKQPDLVTKENGVKILNFTLAVNRDHKKKNEDKDEWFETTSFFDLTLFGKRAEGLQKWLQKGKLVSVRSHLEQERWEKDGKNYSRTKIFIDDINPFLERIAKPQSEQAETSNAQVENPETQQQFPNLTQGDMENEEIY